MTLVGFGAYVTYHLSHYPILSTEILMFIVWQHQNSAWSYIAFGVIVNMEVMIFRDVTSYIFFKWFLLSLHLFARVSTLKLETESSLEMLLLSLSNCTPLHSRWTQYRHRLPRKPHTPNDGHSQLYACVFVLCRSQWPCGLRRGSAAARLLRLWVRTPSGAWMSVCCECCVSSGRGLCDELIIRPEESYRLWCVVVCDLEASRITRS